MKYTKIFFFTCLVLVIKVTIAQTELPNFFSDGMVLQQQTEVAIWGTDKPLTKITIKSSWGKSANTTTDENGKWKIKLTTPIAGGPYTLDIKGTKKINLKNILIGEVWFCSGQSNMEMPVKGFNSQPIIGSNEAILNSTNNQIRFFNTPRSVSITPLENSKGEWKSAQPSNTGNFSATAYFFAKKVQSMLNVPVGIIQSAWGASTIESWMDKTTLQEIGNKKIPEKTPDSFPNKTPTIMYNSMLHPYIGYSMKGMLWYQGEGNRDNANEYKALSTAMITALRKQWQIGDFPFYFVQIAPFKPGKPNAAFLREAQLQTMQTVANTGMAVTMDIGEETVIHPAQKEQVGIRLAYWALAKTYNMQGFAFSGPVYREMQITNNGRIFLKFDYAEQGLSSFGKPLTDFEIAGEDKIFYPAQAKIQNDKNGQIVVWSDSVKNPLHVRYAFKNWAEGSLFNIQGLPASSFRTDNW